MMKLRARIIEELANPTTVFISANNCKTLGINAHDYDETRRFLQIKNGVNFIWQSVYTSSEVTEDEILIPEQIAVNLPDLQTTNEEVNVKKWSVEQANTITSITLEKLFPKERSLASRRSYFINMTINISFPIVRHFLLTMPVQLANKEIVQTVFRVKDLALQEPFSADDLPALMPSNEEEIEVNIVNLGHREEEQDELKGFSLVGGLEEQIRMVREVVELPFNFSTEFAQLGIRPSKGILLEGPPGTGKTLIARAVAQTTKAKFIKLNASELFSEFVGRSEEKLRSIFEEAEQAERAIIFIDEIDALAVRRDFAQEDFSRRLVGQFLPLLDGVDDDGRVVVIAATNRPDAIDPAFRRPGRFDREVTIGIPNEKARYEILKIHVRRMKLANDVDLKAIAKSTHAYVGADL